jgi:hypothetical protein
MTDVVMRLSLKGSASTLLVAGDSRSAEPEALDDRPFQA